MKHPHLLILSFLSFFALTATAQPTANFAAGNSTAGCVPHTVSFSNLSSGNGNPITTWEWTKNGDFLSNEEDPVHIFTSAGTYEICLTVTDNNNLSSTECKTNFVTVFSLPVANFAMDNDLGCGPLTVNFSDNSTSQSGTINNWVWDLNGCPSTNAPNVQCIYESADSYQVTLIVTDDNGCSDNITQFVTVEEGVNLGLTADLTYACTLPFEVNFTNTSTLAGNNFHWDFGNGEEFDGNNPDPVTYETAGPFTVTLSGVNTTTGCRDTLVLEDYIAAGAPPSFTSVSQNGCGDLTIFFEDTSSGPPATSISWDFGDNTSSNDATPIHTYAAVDCYDVTLTRTVNGCVISTTEQVCITNSENLDVSYVVTSGVTESCTIPFTVSFDGQSSDAISWFWDFGDNTTSTEENPTHTYTELGSYPVSLTIEDALGCTKTVSLETIELQEILPKLGFGKIKDCAPISVTLNENSASTAPIVAWNWTVLDEAGATVFTSSQENPILTVTETGCYDIVVEVTNDLGCVASRTFGDRICAGEVFPVDFDVTPDVACSSQIISFTSNTNPAVDDYEWDFNNDGIIDSFDPNPTYEYADTGCFTVTLRIFDEGCENFVSKTDVVCILPPVAKFSTVIDCDQPFERTFLTAYTIGADSVFWDFGVSTTTTDTSSADNPTFVFPQTGVYPVTLIAYNFETNCSDTLTKNIRITQPEINISVDTMMGCLPLRVYITNNSVDIVKWKWIKPPSSIINISDDEAAEPNIRFGKAGEFYMTLAVEDVNRCTDTTQIGPFRINDIDVGFEVEQLNDCLPVNLNFTDTSSNLFATNIDWTWIIGDTIALANGQNPMVSIDTVGFLPITLQVTDTWGCMKELVVNEGINIDAPLANFSANTFTCPGEPVVFENLSQGNGLTYFWDFGDTGSTMDEHPTHLYSIGNYTACLTVTDIGGCVNTTCQEISVEETIAAFTVDSSYSNCTPSLVQYINQSQGATSYIWEYGDASGTDNQENPTHIFIDKGIYFDTLIAIGGTAGCRDTVVQSLNLLGLVGNFTYTVNDNCIPAEVNFFGESDRNYIYMWDFGDGNVKTSFDVDRDTVVHLYDVTPVNGFVPLLRIIEIDNPDCTELIDPQDTIFLSYLEVDFMASDTNICNADAPINFESMINTGDPIINVDWTFEQGQPGTSSDLNPVVDYDAIGEFDVQLIIDNGNCIDTLTKMEYIRVLASPEIDGDDVTICVGDTIQLEAYGNVDYYIWSPSETLSDPFIATPTASPTTTTDYVVLGGSATCPPDSTTVTVTVLEQPDLVLNRVYEFFPGSTIDLSVAVNGNSNYDYQWSPITNLSCWNCPNPTVTEVDTNMTYYVTVTDLNSFCTSTDSVLLRELSACPDDLIEMPNAFSPNDDGFNDVLRMFSNSIFEINSFRIYDRWGGLMWETSDINEGWDGRRKGRDADVGVYIYVIEAPCKLDGEVIIKKGDVTLLR